jgi:hypothetical protein
MLLLCCVRPSSCSVSLTEIEKARQVAERALKAISFRSPQEKLNVWIALLNLENMYGTQKTMQTVFNRAVQFADPLTVYMEVAKIYSSTKKVEVSRSIGHSAWDCSHPSLLLDMTNNFI